MIIVSEKPTYKNYCQQLHEMADRLASYKTHPDTRQQDVLRKDRRPHARKSTPSRAGTSPALRDLNTMNWQSIAG